MRSRPPSSFGGNVVEFPGKVPLILEYELGQTVNPDFAMFYVKPLMQSTVLNLIALTMFFTEEDDDDMADLCRYLATELQREGKNRV